RCAPRQKGKRNSDRVAACHKRRRSILKPSWLHRPCSRLCLSQSHWKFASKRCLTCPKRMYARATFRESVDKAVFGENLKAAASSTTDPEVLLGLAFLVQTG